MLKQLATAIYYVDDLQQAKSWLKQIFNIDPYFDEPFYMGYSIGGYEMGVMPKDSATDSVGKAALCYWRVDNIEQAMDQFIERGAKMGDPIEDVGGDIKVGSIVDPFGNHFGLIENCHFTVPAVVAGE